MSDVHIGRFLTGDEARDAIHIAIAPVTACDVLRPGDAVYVAPEEGSLNAYADPTVMRDGLALKLVKVGIVDPFLWRSVDLGERFYVFLYPRTIKSLRHAWAHPAFPPEGPDVAAVADSRAWIKSWAESFGSTYDEVVKRAQDYVDYDEYWVEGDRFEDEAVPNEFWRHYVRATGRKGPEDGEGSFFSCAC